MYIFITTNIKGDQGDPTSILAKQQHCMYVGFCDHHCGVESYARRIIYYSVY